AEPLFKRALATREKTLGSEHPDAAQSLNNLAAFYYTQNRSAEALPLIRRAAAIYSARFVADGSESELRDRRHIFIDHLAIVQAVMKSRPDEREALMGEAVAAMQLSHASSVATAVAQMAARFAAGNDALAAVVRERQDTTARWHA